MNLFRVANESDLDDIMNKNIDKLVLVMFGSKNCPQSTIVKPKFIDLSKMNQDSLFVFIDITKFDEVSKKYTTDLKGTPKFAFYFNNNNLGCIYGPDHNILYTHFNGIKQKLQIFRQQKQKEEPAPTQVPDNKAFILSKLHEMQKVGIVLSQNYTMDSDFNQMYNEYKMQIALIEKKLEQQDTAEKQLLLEKLTTLYNSGTNIVFSSADSLEKLRGIYASIATQPTPTTVAVPKKREEKIKEIHELDKLNRLIQMQQFTKLQMLKRLQKMKEMEEKRETERMTKEERDRLRRGE
jgi:thiol-disulfide isomerase/thioredoxin